MSEPLPHSLEHAVIPQPVLDVLQRLQQRGFAALLVGGCVRDLVRGEAPKDYDVATSAHPGDVQQAFKKVIPTGLQHGTVTVVSGGLHVEVTTFRTEGHYQDGRRPSSVEFRTEVADDLSRRDFTINAMAYDPISRRLVDPFGGRMDLQRRVVRCVGSAALRFSEDGLRPLRAVRFAAVLGFDLEPQTAAAIPNTLDVFRKVSRERIRVEFEKLLLCARAGLGLELLHESHLLGVFLPEALGHGFKARAAAAQRAPSELPVRLAIVLSHVEPAVVRNALKRLTFPTRVLERAAHLLAHPIPEPPLQVADATLRRWMSELGPEAVDDAVAFHLARVQPPHGEAQAVRDRLHALLAARPALSTKDLALNGAEIMEQLGVGPSRLVGEATRFLLDCVLDDPAQNSAKTLAVLLRDWARSRAI